jgi:hypothetical protein
MCGVDERLVVVLLPVGVALWPLVLIGVGLLMLVGCLVLLMLPWSAGRCSGGWWSVVGFVGCLLCWGGYGLWLVSTAG